MADENRVIKEISCKLFHTAKAWNDLLAQLLVDMAKYIPPKQLQAEGFVSLSSQKRFAMAKHIPSDLVHMAKDYATFLSQSLFGMANYISRELLRMGKGCASILSEKLFLMAGYVSSKLSDMIKELWQLDGTGIGKASVLVILALLLLDSGKGPKGTKPPPCPAGFSPSKEIHTVTRTNKPTEPKNYPELSLKKIVIAPEIKKPTEPKYEQTSSSSSMNAAPKSLLPVYAVPDDLKDLIKKDKVPQVLRNPLTASTYSAYSAVVAPEIKKPTEPKYEQTSSSSSTNAARKSLLPVYAVPDVLKDLIKKDQEPQVLRNPLTASTYYAYSAVVAPEIKKPTEPKYEQTSSSSSMNAAPKSLLPVYAVPDDLKDLIEKDEVPQVLRNTLTASTYSAYSTVVAPEIKKPTEPKYEQTSSSSSTNAARKSLLPVYAVPDGLKDLIKKDKVPQVLRDPLTASTYSAYFAALLNAEDYYIEKWNGFLMFNVTLQLHEELSHAMKIKNSFSKKNKDGTKIGSGDKKVYVVFEIGSVPENRPFLLSRDFVYIKPAGMEVEPFKGYLSRVVKNNHVWTEFGDDFFSQYSPHCKYDVRFSFNRVPLKRAHDAVAAASDPSFQTFLFPDPTSRTGFSIPISVIPSNRNLGQDQVSAISQILNLKEPPPYLVEGPLSIIYSNQISRTGVVIREAILQIYKASRNYKVLIAAPKNHTCDVLMESLQLEIPRSETFRANAAFRDPSEVPEGIFSSSLYEGECFTCPPLAELRNYRVITSTYISSFRLRSSGINAGHFSHIFLVDASSASEPDTMVALTNLADEKTAVVVTGTLNDHPGRLRSDIARKKGLAVSYFERLLNRKPYSDQDPRFVKRICIENSESY